MTESAVRFITPISGPDRGLVSRLEGMSRCRGCARLHPYRLDRFTNPDESPVAIELEDSWEDAAHQIREWLPDGARYVGHRETESEDDEPIEQEFDSRELAIAWLLGPEQ